MRNGNTPATLAASLALFVAISFGTVAVVRGANNEHPKSHPFTEYSADPTDVVGQNCGAGRDKLRSLGLIVVLVPSGDEHFIMDPYGWRVSSQKMENSAVYLGCMKDSTARRDVVK